MITISGMFSNIPNLQTLDVSGNLLSTLDLPTFVPLIDLKYVNLEKNFLKCDKSTQYLMDWLRKHSIKYEGHFCAVQRKDMFQRMEMSLDKINTSDIQENDMLKNTSLAKMNATAVEKEFVMSLFNKTYFKRCLMMDHEFVCHLLENCKESLNCEKYMEEQQRHTKINFYFIIAIFVIGMFIGAVLALCCCQACIYCRTDKQRRRHGRIYETVDPYRGVQMRSMNDTQRQRYNQEYSSSAPPPPPGDRERYTESALVESNGFHDFVNELFSRRRSRRQMISAIGQQGTNLVRQLSRSSMNLLRRSQSRAANASARNAANQPPQTPQTPITPPVYESLDYSTAPPPEIRERSRSFTYSPDMINSNNDYLIQDLLSQQRRSESPPPNYDLCVRLPKSGYISE